MSVLNHVQLVLDRDQHQNPGAGDADHADRGRLRRGTGEILHPKRRLFADRRHKISESEAEQLLPSIGEAGKHRQDADDDNAERHQRDQGRIAQRARGGEAAVTAEAVQRV